MAAQIVFFTINNKLSYGDQYESPHQIYVIVDLLMRFCERNLLIITVLNFFVTILGFTVYSLGFTVYNLGVTVYSLLFMV